MHEMGIANSILDAVQAETGRYPGSRPIKVGVRLGELAAIDPESLRFCFEAMVSETEFEGLQLEIEWSVRRHRCRDCGSEFEVSDYDFECPDCHALSSECIAGDELELTYVEVEEHEPCPVGTQDSE
jgi:hydrogenase nickel incorporation protein HypA/HybF